MSSAVNAERFLRDMLAIIQRAERFRHSLKAR